MTSSGTQVPALRLASPQGRWLLLVTVLGSGLAMLDATVVNVALGQIGAEFDAEFAGLQWTLNGYALTLASFILLGGSLGDRLGRRRIFIIGTVWFAAASLLCGIAPNVELLVAARALQGVGGALLTPGSLAIISASLHPDDRSRAIGAWSGLGGIAAAIGPFLGGYLVDVWSWRLVFLINLPLSVLVVVVALRYVPETVDPQASPQLDVPGAVLGAAGLAGLTYALIAAGDTGWSAVNVARAVAGVVFLLAFVPSNGAAGIRWSPSTCSTPCSSRRPTSSPLSSTARWAGCSSCSCWSCRSSQASPLCSPVRRCCPSRS